MIEIDGPLWFLAALLICGVHLIYLRGERRDRRRYWAWWKRYEVDARKQHDEFMRALGRKDSEVEWNLDGSRERGQA